MTPPKTRAGRSRRLGLAACPAWRGVPRGHMRVSAFRARRFAVVTGVALALTVIVAPSALAYWHSAGAGSGAGTTGTLAAPTGVTASASGATVTVNWTAPTPPSGTLAGYTVIRYAGATPSNACGTDPANSATFIPAGTLTCADPSVPAGTYTYTVIAVWRSWTAESAASSTVTVTAVLKWFGDGTLGQGGVADFSAELSPTQESTGATTWNAVSSGGSNGCATRTDHTLWCWGLNTSGQLGVGGLLQASPTQITGTTWAAVGTGSSYTCATKTNGTLWCWGDNSVGELGQGNLTAQASPVQVGALTTWATVSAAAGDTCATKTDGTLWCWGNNSQGQIGIGSIVTPQKSPVQVGVATTWATVEVGDQHACATKSDGTLWCWGNNADYQVGIGNNVTPQMSPIQVGVATTWASVSAGSSHTCGTQTDGTLWCWGRNNNGQAGVGNYATRQFTPAQVGVATTWATVGAGSAFTCATRTGGGTLWCWGVNTNGQLGAGNTTQTNVPGQVGALSTWAAVGAGGLGHTCAPKADGTLWCWGQNTYGQLGDGATRATSTRVQVGAATSWTSAGSGTSHACGVLAAGTLWCWGQNNYGQLGVGSTATKYVPTQVAGTTWATVAVGTIFTCATKTDGSLWCWGYDGDGQLGIGIVAIQTSPVRVGLLNTWTQASAGAGGTCATRTDHTLWCWGLNNVGQVGIGNVVTPQGTPVQVGAAVTNWDTVTVGYSHTCATRTDHTLWCWGDNTGGQVGIGSVATPQVSPVQIGAAVWNTVGLGWLYSCATRTDGTLWCWGRNVNGQLGIGSVSPQTSPVQVGAATTWNTIAAAHAHTCATRTDSTLWCWGQNTYGQLGLGDYTQRTSPTQLSGTATRVVAGVLADQTFTLG